MKFKFGNDRPIYVQLIEQLESEIVSGRMPPGSKLPSVRELAILAKVNPNTMQKALGELEELRLITTERTNGKFVTTSEKRLKKYRDKFAEKQAEDYLQAMQELGYSTKAAIKFLRERS